MAMEGFSELTTPAHLLQKLEREYARLQASPMNVDHAWNFFVTAEHLPDWISGGQPRMPTGETLKAFKQRYRLTRVCSHLANGGKHFAPLPFHDSVSGIARDGVYEPGVYDEAVFEEWLSIHLTPPEVAAWGKANIDVRELAGKVLAFWQLALRGTSTL
jgi:hypothetical protein